MSNFILSFPKGPIRFPSLGWLIIFTAHTYLGKNDLFLYLYLWNTTSRGINIKAHSGIWDTRSIWPISNSEDRYCSRHPKYNSASPRGILGHSSSICPPRLISSKFPSSPPNTTRLRLVVFGVTLEILLKYLLSPQIPLGFASWYLGWLEVFQAKYYLYLKYPRPILYNIPLLIGISVVYQTNLDIPLNILIYLLIISYTSDIPCIWFYTITMQNWPNQNLIQLLFSLAIHSS